MRLRAVGRLLVAAGFGFFTRVGKQNITVERVGLIVNSRFVGIVQEFGVVQQLGEILSLGDGDHRWLESQAEDVERRQATFEVDARQGVGDAQTHGHGAQVRFIHWLIITALRDEDSSSVTVVGESELKGRSQPVSGEQFGVL